MTCVKVPEPRWHNLSAMPRQHTRRVPTTPSLLRMRSRSARAPWGARLLAAWMVLSLTFALTPCCDIVGMANAAPAPAVANHDQVPDAHADSQAPDSGDPCATWLDRSDAVPPKVDDTSSSTAKVVLATPLVFLPSASPAAATAWRPFHLSASPPVALYLRHARLIL